MCQFVTIYNLSCKQLFESVPTDAKIRAHKIESENLIGIGYERK